MRRGQHSTNWVVDCCSQKCFYYFLHLIANIKLKIKFVKQFFNNSKTNDYYYIEPVLSIDTFIFILANVTIVFYLIYFLLRKETAGKPILFMH